MKPKVVAIVCGLAAGISAVGRADEPATVAACMARLADPAFAVREQASEELLKLSRGQPRETETALVDGYRNSPDPEVRFRCKDILMKLFADSSGYLGVRYQPHQIADGDGNARLVVRVGAIEPDSPARAAGLKEGDLITGLNGVPLHADLGGKEFARQVQQTGAGADLHLDVSRDGKTLKLKVRLGNRPAAVAPAQDPEELFKLRLERIEKARKKD